MWIFQKYHQDICVHVQVHPTSENAARLKALKDEIFQNIELSSQLKEKYEPVSLGRERYGYSYMFENTNENWYDVTIKDISNYRRVEDAIFGLRSFFPEVTREEELIKRISIEMTGRSLLKRRVDLEHMRTELKKFNLSSFYDNSFFPRLCFRSTLLNMYPRKKVLELSMQLKQENT